MPYTITRENADRDASIVRDAVSVLREVGGLNEEATLELEGLADSIDAGVGARNDAYNQGTEDFAAKMRRELMAQEAQVITGPEKRCYRDVLGIMAALLGEG